MAAKKTTKKATSIGSPTLDAANAAKKFKAPKDYKPLTTAQKLAMAASVVGPGKVVKGAQALNKLAKGKKVVKTLAEPKSHVKVKPAAKTKPNKPDTAKTNYKNMDTYERARKAEIKAGNDPQTAHEVARGMSLFYAKRKPNLSIKTSVNKPDVRKPARKPSESANTTRIINSAKDVRVTRVNPKALKAVVKKKSK